MEAKSQYFQLVEKEGKMYLRIFPSESGGKKLDLKEVLAYLEDTGYGNFELRELNQVVTQNARIEDVYVGEWNGFQQHETMMVNISGDQMLAYARFYPPTAGGDLMDKDAILKDLKAGKIVHGILDNAIEGFLKNREYCNNILIAKGTPPMQGKDARVEYFFNTNMNLRPKRNKDGSVDYHQLNTINRVEEGQRLAKLHKNTIGEPGMDIFGGIISPKQTKSKKLSFSTNIELSEDGTEIFSKVMGHVRLVNEKVFVSDIYEIAGDVDNTTGDVEYDGNIWIKGTVRDGFKVKTKGDIVVEGVVEGAELYAGGQIIVQRGILGMSKGILKAKGNIITKFIENATIISEGYVETESILHSTVSARTDVKVQGRRGFISGGTIRAGNVIDAINIGSEMGSNTKLEVGVDPEVKERYLEIQKDIAQLNKEMDQIRPILRSFTERAARLEEISVEKQFQMQQLAKRLKEKQQKLVDLHDEFDILYESMALATRAKVKVRGTIYQGVWVGISDVGMNMKSNYSFIQISKEDGELTIGPL